MNRTITPGRPEATVSLRPWARAWFVAGLLLAAAVAPASAAADAPSALCGRAVQLRSWKGDFLHRPDGPPGVTTWGSGIGNVWLLDCAETTVRLRSWKYDHLHRPDGPEGVTAWAGGGPGDAWTLVPTGDKVQLQSWKGDFLHRPDTAQGVTTLGSGIGNLWTLEPVDCPDPCRVLNLAFGRPARQSSTTWDSPAARATDGRADGNWAAGSVTHTGVEPAPWLEVDLGGPRPIGQVAVYNRSDCCQERLHGVRLEISSTPCDRPTPVDWVALPTDPAAMLPSYAIGFRGLAARYVCVRHTRSEVVSVAEIEVYGAVGAIADVDACRSAPCGPGAACTDREGVDATSAGRTCTCPAGTTPGAGEACVASTGTKRVILEGDIEAVVPADWTPPPVGSKEHLSTAGRFAGRTLDSTITLWDRSTIPYLLTPEVERYRGTLRKVIQELHLQTNLTFREVPAGSTPPEKYVRIGFDGASPDQDSCSSAIGAFSPTTLTLRSGCGDDRGVVLHELMHAAGFPHEQSRVDRDQYVTVFTANIANSANEHNFDIHYAAEALGPYDFKSIMHYRGTAYAKPGTKTLVSKVPGSPVDPGEHLSDLDVAGVNRAYPSRGPGVVLYTDARHEGLAMRVFGDVPALSEVLPMFGNDSVSSLRLEHVGRVALYEDRDFKGACIDADQNLSHMPDRWNDRVSSLRVDQSCDTAPMVIFKDAAFGGTKREVTGDLYTLGPLNDEVTSVRLAPGTKAALFTDANLRGACLTLETSISSLSGTIVGNDKVSSIAFNRPCPRVQVVLYRDAHHDGGTLELGADVANLKTHGFNDSASSVKVSGIAALYSDANYGGRCLTVTGEIKQLSKTSMGNDSVSSVRVGRGC